MQIIKPKRLQEGDTVAVVSPSSAVTEELRDQFNNGIKFLEGLGLKVKIGKNALGRYYYSSGTTEERLNDIHEAFADKSVKAIIMSIGGSIANNILDGLDFELIKKNPKMFSGISDGTTLLDSIFSKTGLVAYYGPDLVFTFGGPILPHFITHEKRINDLVNKLEEAGAIKVWFEHINLNAKIKARLYDFFNKKAPELIPYFDKANTNKYREKLDKIIYSAMKGRKLKMGLGQIIYHNKKFKK